VQFDLGNLAMVTGGHNNGRVGTIVHKEKHRGGHDIVHIEDSSGNRWVAEVSRGPGFISMVNIWRQKGGARGVDAAAGDGLDRRRCFSSIGGGQQLQLFVGRYGFEFRTPVVLRVYLSNPAFHHH